MRRGITSLLLIVLLLGPSVGNAIALTTSIRIAPNSIVIYPERPLKGEWVTVHTDIPFGQVNAETVTLNSVDMSWCKADNKGNFVAKFDLQSIVNVLGKSSGLISLYFEGFTVDGSPIDGSDTISIVRLTCKKDLGVSLPAGRRLGFRSPMFSKLCEP